MAWQTHWSATWSPGDRLPAEIEEASIEREIVVANRACEPIDPERLGAALTVFLLPWKVEQDWQHGIADFYVMGLSDLPDDLLQLALIRMSRTATWRPKPAEIREAVASEFTARLQARCLLRIALKQLQWQRGLGQ